MTKYQHRPSNQGQWVAGQSMRCFYAQFHIPQLFPENLLANAGVFTSPAGDKHRGLELVNGCEAVPEKSIIFPGMSASLKGTISNSNALQ